MATLLGYMNMKEKNGKVLVLCTPINNNGDGFTTYTKCVYDSVSDSITRDSLGKEISFGLTMEVRNA